MSSGNPRGKPRRNGSALQDYGAQQQPMYAAGPPMNVMQRAQPPQSMANGNAGGGGQPSQLGSIPFQMPGVEGHMMQYRNAQQNFANPSICYRAGEAQLERTPHGNPQLATLQRVPQPQQNYASTAQSHINVGTFPNAPPVFNASMPPEMCNTIYSNYTQQYYAPNVPPQLIYFNTNQPSEYNPQNLTAGYESVGMHPTPAVQPSVSLSANATALQQRKKILRIVNPDTREVMNKDVIEEQESKIQDTTNPDEVSRRETPTINAGGFSRESSSPVVASNASQAFVRKVAQSVVDDTNTTMAAVVAPTTGPVSVSSSRAAEETTAPISIGASVVHSVVGQELSPKSQPSMSTLVTAVAALRVEEESVPSENAVVEKEFTKQEEHQETSEALHDVEVCTVVENQFKNDSAKIQVDDHRSPTTAVPNISSVEETSVNTEQTPAPAEATALVAEFERSVVPVVEEENEKEQESLETMAENRMKELLVTQRVYLHNMNSVNIVDRIYGRDYLLLMRDIVKENRQESEYCPVDIIVLKDMGIDIESAPPAGSNSDRQRKFDNACGSKFVPGWVDREKIQSKPKAYHGRLSDRTHSNRMDRDRKRSTISRPSIDRPIRETVKLHKAEKAWKVEVDLDDDQRVFKAVRALLNKITPSNFLELCEDFLKFQVFKYPSLMEGVICIIFDKAVEERHFCSLYSDLCKKQVNVETAAFNTKSKFRDGILNRCQKTFENKEIEEIETLKRELESATEERQRNNIKGQILDLETKERRRMFGNIVFMGQLYRNELIVARVLTWCTVHLLKSHSEISGGDEESIECAVVLLECVGELAEKQATPDFDVKAYIDYLEDTQNTVTNRVRFLILNLLDMRKNGWNKIKPDEGPKTLTQLHDEAKKEEIQNKIQREQYTNTKRQRGGYEGRSSLDRRNPRPAIVGRQSQDGRSYGNRNIEQSREQKARAAGAANMIANTTSRKNQSLNSMDQPQTLGARRPPFSGGAVGGSQGSDRSSQARSVHSMKSAVGRGSQPSSREPSESRRMSREDERNAAIAAAKAITDNAGTSSTGSLKRSAGFARGTVIPGSSASLSPGEEDRKERAVSIPDESDSPFVFAKGVSDIQLFSRMTSDFSGFFFFHTETVEEVFDKVLLYITNPATLCVDHTLVPTIFQLLMQIGVERANVEVKNRVGQLLCRSFQRIDFRLQALEGIANYCNHIVQIELWEDNMRIWEAVAEVISWAIMCDMKYFEGPRPSLGDFKEAFQVANGYLVKPNALLVNVLKRLVEIAMDRDGCAQSAGMAFGEIKSLHSDSLIAELKACSVVSGENLYQLLLN